MMFLRDGVGGIALLVAVVQVTAVVHTNVRTDKILQKLPEGCDEDEQCPRVEGDMSAWERRQAACCKTPTVFFCQEQTDPRRVISACVQKSICPKGTYGKLFTEKTQDGQKAWTECLPCGKGYYEGRENPSYKFRFDHCSWTKTVCKPEYGKELCENGSTTEDDKCRCRYEDGYAPNYPDRCLCFGVHDPGCRCEKKDCTEGQELDKNYECVPVPSSTSSSTSDREEATETSVSPPTTPNTADEEEEDDAPALHLFPMFFALLALMFQLTVWIIYSGISGHVRDRFGW